MIRRRRRLIGVLLAFALGAGLIGVGAVATNAIGLGDRFDNVVDRVVLFLDPPPDRPIPATVRVTPRPTLPATPVPSSPPTSGGPTASADPRATPDPTPAPTPARVPVDVDLLASVDPARYFAAEIDKEWCAVAGTQMVLAIHARGNITGTLQKELASRIGEWESWRDSHNGGWGPASISAALDAYGVPGYEIRAYERREDALRDAAVAISATNAPVVLLTWRGAHTWVMTGYRADADPAAFPDARITGTYILDPWYDRPSSIWGFSDPPGTFQDTAEMERNYLPWQRPEGRYPDRDGLFIAVVPTIPRAAGP